MELRQLRHLMAVVEHGSFSRAAEVVHLTQSALSRSIQALEASVGTPVLERNRGDLAPTPVGQLLLEHARRLDTATRDLERDIALTQGLELGELRVGVGPYGGAALVGPVIGQLHQQHPGLRIKAVLAPWQELPERARMREVDLIVLELSQVQQMDDFAVLGLGQHPMLAVCRPQHPVTALAHPSTQDIFRYPLAGPTTTLPQTKAVTALLPPDIQATLQKNSLFAVECDFSGVLKDVLRNSDAVSLLPAFAVTQELALGLLTKLSGVDTGLQVRFGCAWLKERTVSPAAQRFMEFLSAHDRSLVVAHSEPATEDSSRRVLRNS